MEVLDAFYERVKVAIPPAARATATTNRPLQSMYPRPDDAGLPRPIQQTPFYPAPRRHASIAQFSTSPLERYQTISEAPEGWPRPTSRWPIVTAHAGGPEMDPYGEQTAPAAQATATTNRTFQSMYPGDVSLPPRPYPPTHHFRLGSDSSSGPQWAIPNYASSVALSPPAFTMQQGEDPASEAPLAEQADPSSKSTPRYPVSSMPHFYEFLIAYVTMQACYQGYDVDDNRSDEHYRLAASAIVRKIGIVGICMTAPPRTGRRVDFVPLPVGMPSDKKHIVHWRIHIIYERGGKYCSLLLDLAKRPAFEMGARPFPRWESFFNVMSRDTETSSRGSRSGSMFIVEWKMDIPNPFTISNVLEYLKRFQKYRIPIGGSGCFHWTLTIFEEIVAFLAVPRARLDSHVAELIKAIQAAELRHPQCWVIRVLGRFTDREETAACNSLARFAKYGFLDMRDPDFYGDTQFFAIINEYRKRAKLVLYSEGQFLREEPQR